MRVGEVADVDSGPAFKSSLFGGPGEGTRLLRGDNIEPGSLRWGRTRSWPDSQLDGFEHLLVAEGDIILAMDRPVVSAGLKLARATAADMPALLVQRVARIRPRAAVSGDFLHQILSSRHFIQQLLGNQVGTQIPHITLEAIREFAFVLPEPAIQIAIAKQVRAHVESSERVEHDIAVAATRSHSLRRALLSAAFTGRLTRRIADMERVEEMAGV
jgi:type I restriction enzyme S subunit